jgi:hypothetical protein
LILPLNKYPQNHIIVDGENHALRFDCAYSVSSMSIKQAIDEILDKHGKNNRLLVFSGTSAGAGIFQVDSKQAVIGLHIQSAIEPEVRLQEKVDIESVKLDEIVIDRSNKRIYAGSSITLDQLNRALAGATGFQYRVLGADLTSYTYAQVGATFMTGGMGPQRRYFSDSVFQVALHDGDDMLTIEGDELQAYAGTYGWTGIVTAVGCEFVELPLNEVAFALPVKNTPDDLAKLLAHLSPFTLLRIDADSIVASQAGYNLILGIEHITSEAMQPFLESGDNELTKRAARLKSNCEEAGADGVIFVSAYTNLDIDEFLLTLVDDSEAEDYTIAGISLEHTEIFKDPEQMRAVREGIPYAARMQAPKGKYSFKGHTDANIALNPQCVEKAMRQLWQLNQQYVAAVQSYFDQNEELRGEILVYGHLNPVGVDPHNRITFASDDESAFNQANRFLDDYRDRFIRDLAKLCDDTGSDFVGGEKSAGSEYEMIPVLGEQAKLPRLLSEKYFLQRECIRQSSPLFNWRALAPYRE